MLRNARTMTTRCPKSISIRTPKEATLILSLMITLSQSLDIVASIAQAAAIQVELQTEISK